TSPACKPKASAAAGRRRQTACRRLLQCGEPCPPDHGHLQFHGRATSWKPTWCQAADWRVEVVDNISSSSHRCGLPLQMRENFSKGILMTFEDIDFLIIGATKSATTWLQKSLQAD